MGLTVINCYLTLGAQEVQADTALLKVKVPIKRTFEPH